MRGCITVEACDGRAELRPARISGRLRTPLVGARRRYYQVGAGLYANHRNDENTDIVATKLYIIYGPVLLPATSNDLWRLF